MCCWPLSGRLRGCRPSSSLIRRTRLRFFGQLSRADSKQVQHRVISVCISTTKSLEKTLSAPTHHLAEGNRRQLANTGIHSARKGDDLTVRSGNVPSTYPLIIDTVTLYYGTLCLKTAPTFKLSVTLLNLNRFSKCLHCWKAYELCYKNHITLSTSPWSFCYTTLGTYKFKFSAAVEENAQNCIFNRLQLVIHPHILILLKFKIANRSHTDCK